MRPLALLTSTGVLLALQQLFSLWFIADFFLARDSSTAHELWTSDKSPYHEETFPKINKTINNILARDCSAYAKEGPDFEKLIFIVIDALGSDFIPTLREEQRPSHDGQKEQQKDENDTAIGMPFLERLIQENKALGFRAKAATPTVTMPRIKALVSGTIPSFVDILYNLASDVSKFEDENLLGLARAQNKSIVFYGDDTWLSLFDRSTFLRVKETFSFLATDFIMVDVNVTDKALPETVKQNIDWDFLIMHYLGLDHIGHTFGSNRHELVGLKLADMDNVIKVMYNNMAIKRERTLMVVCGDHGMSKEGNHGGDTALESSTAMIFVPINREYGSLGSSQLTSLKNIDQIDLAATLSFLFGLPIPSSSKGVIIEALLRKLWTNDETKLKCAILENLLELIRLSDLSELEFSSSIVNSLVKVLQTEIKAGGARKLTSHYWAIARDIKHVLTKTATSQSSMLLMIFVLTFMMFLSAVALRRTCIRLLLPLSSPSQQWSAAFFFVMPILSLGSTDFIEGERSVWPFIALLYFSIACLHSYRHNFRSFMALLEQPEFNATTMSLFSWGYMMCITKSYRDYLFKNIRYMDLLPMIILSNYLRNNMHPSRTLKRTRYAAILLFSLILLALKHFGEHYSPAMRAAMERCSMTFLLLFFMMDFFVMEGMDGRSIAYLDVPKPAPMLRQFATVWLGVTFLLSRWDTLVFYVGNMVLEVNANKLLNAVKMAPIFRALVYACFAQCAFYCQGNTNVFSSINVRPAFFGQTEYHAWLAVPLVAMSTYSMQIYWHLKLMQRVQENEEKLRGSLASAESDATFKAVCDFINLRNFLSLGYFMYVCMVLRNHLFIWSVISPKLVYHYVTNLMVLIGLSAVRGARFMSLRTLRY